MYSKPNLSNFTSCKCVTVWHLLVVWFVKVCLCPFISDKWIAFVHACYCVTVVWLSGSKSFVLVSISGLWFDWMFHSCAHVWQLLVVCLVKLQLLFHLYCCQQQRHEDKIDILEAVAHHMQYIISLQYTTCNILNIYDICSILYPCITPHVIYLIYDIMQNIISLQYTTLQCIEYILCSTVQHMQYIICNPLYACSIWYMHCPKVKNGRINK